MLCTPIWANSWMENETHVLIYSLQEVFVSIELGASLNTNIYWPYIVYLLNLKYKQILENPHAITWLRLGTAFWLNKEHFSGNNFALQKYSFQYLPGMI